MGIFATEADAAKAVAHALRVTVASLRKKPADRLADATQRFSRSFAPADLEAGVQHWQKSHALFKAEPSY